MFTGIIKSLGRFYGYRSGRSELLVEAPEAINAALKPGDSLAVNGVCLTLADREKKYLIFNLSSETRLRTTIGNLKPEKALNLELPLTLASPLGGHLLTGHVDYVGKIIQTENKPPGKRFKISTSAEHKKFIATKGSIAIDGVSLTVARINRNYFEVELIPVTLKETNLGELRAGASVNVECDIVAKYMYNYYLQEVKKFKP